jgi:hypothetical protein
MMPTSPWPPLKFRAVGFPQHGLKAGISDEAFPREPGLPSSFVLAASIAIPCSGSGAVWPTQHLHASGFPLYPRGPRSDRVMLSRSSPLNRPHASHSSAHPDFASSRFIRDALAVPNNTRPRQPTSGSELSLMVFRNMSPSETPGNFPVALTQCFTGNSGLRHGANVSAFPSSSHSDPGEGAISGLNHGSLALRPVALPVPLSEQTRLASSPRGRLHPGFQRLGHPRRRRISLQCQLGNLHWRDSHPLDHQLASLHDPGPPNFRMVQRSSRTHN